jgi:hypothetical protein
MSYCDDDACNEPAHDCSYRDKLERQNTKLREAAQEGLEGLQWAHRMWSAGGSEVAAFKMLVRIDAINAALEEDK